MATSNSTRLNPRPFFFRCMAILVSLAESRNISYLGITPDHAAHRILHPHLNLALIRIRAYTVLQEHCADYDLPLKICQRSPVRADLQSRSFIEGVHDPICAALKSGRHSIFENAYSRGRTLVLQGRESNRSSVAGGEYSLDHLLCLML